MRTAKTLIRLGGDAQSHQSLCWAHSHFVGFVMSRLIWMLYSLTGNELPHDKINKMACVPSEDSDQPGSLATH